MFAVSRAGGVLLALLLVASATGAWAHEGPHAAAPVAEPAPERTGAGVDALVLAALVAAGLLVASRPGRPVLGLAVLLAVMGFEARLHAVHHLGDPARAAECPVAVATAHLTGSPADTETAHVVVTRTFCPILPGLPALVVLRLPAPHEGRAPPSSPA